MAGEIVRYGKRFWRKYEKDYYDIKLSYSHYSETSPHSPEGKKVFYYHAIKDFISNYGEKDEFGLGQKLYIPDYAHVNGDWGDGVDFPVLLIKVNGSVQHAVPNWEKVWQHSKYHQCRPKKEYEMIN